jgi:aerobic-type carbon monoxide dehydrogenase small subunit (CoxS/CutS family)
MVKITVNGEPHDLPVGADDVVADVLRDRLRRTGTKVVCGAGVCGACTVLVDGEPVAGCLLPAVAVDGRSVETVEGVAARGHPVVRAVAAHNALQCGFCTPGFVVAAADLLERNPDPSDDEIREALSGNLCRCTGYAKIFDAVRHAVGRGL